MRNRILSLFIFGIAWTVSSTSHAYLEFAETGDIVPRGTYKVGLGPQIRMSDGSGVNISAYAESGFRDDLGWRAHVGTGDTDFYFGASVKWVPIPDYENQPAIGLRGDMAFANDNRVTTSVFRIAPLISKGFQTDYVYFTPYAALPLGTASTDGGSVTFTQLALGSDIKVDEWRDILFNVELGSNISKAFSYLSLNFFYFFDSGDGLKVRRQR